MFINPIYNFNVVSFRIVLNTIQPCIITAVYNTYNVTCTAKEKHDLILKFRDAIKNYINFDISVCKYLFN